MTAELPQLELLAEVDALAERLRRWNNDAPAWQPAETCRALIRRLLERTESLRVRLDAPLVVATLGGTGTGKSALVNSLAGEEVAPAGHLRPTTTRPTLICRPDTSPEMLGIDPTSVEVVQRDLPALGPLVLIDCPDPDTTETPAGPSNLARLRAILPHCDVLLVTATQQKYRSARVAEELAAAARGARLVFVQTHADIDADIRSDWQRVLGEQYEPGRIFFVDSPAALADARAGVEPRGEFGRLVELLHREMAPATANRIRRANFLDLTADTLAACRQRVDAGLPAVQRLSAAVEEHRNRLVAMLARQVRAELLTSRRQWESRILGQVAARWGFSPFALVLRAWQALGSLAAGALLWRARTPAQMALWGAVAGARSVQKHVRQRQADRGLDRAAAACWDPAELRAAALVLEGYAIEAELPRRAAAIETLTAEAQQAGAGFVAAVSGQLQSLIARLAQRHSGWFTRLRYELLLVVVLGLLLYRLGRNFFYDSWLATPAAPVFGPGFYATAAFWLLLWCLVLIWAFSSRLRRGLRREIDQAAEQWSGLDAGGRLFAELERACRNVERTRLELGELQAYVEQLRTQLATGEKLGHRK